MAMPLLLIIYISVSSLVFHTNAVLSGAVVLFCLIILGHAWC